MCAYLSDVWIDDDDVLGGDHVRPRCRPLQLSSGGPAQLLS
jgi:hypothetical protein